MKLVAATFSAFEFETHALFDDGAWLTATTNMFASLFAGAACRPRRHRGREDVDDVRPPHED